MYRQLQKTIRDVLRAVGRARYLGFLAVLVIGTVGFAYVGVVHRGQMHSSGQEQLLRELVEASQRTAEQGYGALDELRFVVPRQIVDYSTGFTYGDLLAKLKANFERPSTALVDDLSFGEFVFFVAQAFARGDSKFSSVSVNAKPSRGSLTILLLHPRFMDERRGFANSTCYYVGFADVIACNIDRITSVFARINEITENHSLVLAFFEGRFEDGFRVHFLMHFDEIKALLRQNFLIWLIGHEIGHAVLHRDWAIRKAEPLHFDLGYDEREQEADLFVAQRINADPALSVSFGPLLLEFIEHEFRRIHQQRVGKKFEGRIDAGVKAPPPLDIAFDPDTALLLRAVRILRSFVELDPAAMSRLQIRPVGGKFGFIHSVKAAEHARSFGGRLAVQSQPVTTRSTFILLASLLVVAIGTLAVLVLYVRRQGG